MPMIVITMKHPFLPLVQPRASDVNTVVRQVNPVLTLKWITTPTSVDQNIFRWHLIGSRSPLSFRRSFHRETKQPMSPITSISSKNNNNNSIAIPMSLGETGMIQRNNRRNSCPPISVIQRRMRRIVVVRGNINRQIYPRNPIDITNKARQTIERNRRRKRAPLVENSVPFLRLVVAQWSFSLVAPRSSDVPSTKTDAKTGANKSQPVWRPLSPPRPLVTNDPTPQEAITFKSQMKPTDPSTNLNTDRRQSAPTERKSRYTTNTSAINTASIPPLMSVRSDVPAPSTTTGSKHFKNANAGHYSQHNDFYNEGTDAAWGNEDEYYEDETGYYDSTNSNHSRHHQSMTYHSHSHHRGYTTLGPYGRYRRGGTLRHQQPYSNYAPAGASSQLNTSFGSKTKKSVTNRAETSPKKVEETSEPVNSSKTVPSEEAVKKPSVWATESKPKTVEEIPIIKSNEAPIIAKEIEPTHDIVQFSNEPKPLLSIEHEPVMLGAQLETDATYKKPSSAAHAQKRGNQEQRYQNQQAPRHRNTYGRSMQGSFTLQWMPIFESVFHCLTISV